MSDFETAKNLILRSIEDNGYLDEALFSVLKVEGLSTELVGGLFELVNREATGVATEAQLVEYCEDVLSVWDARKENRLLLVQELEKLALAYELDNSATVEATNDDLIKALEQLAGRHHGH